ncbi:MAG: hypothetical protein AB1656_00420 [Candidatus Omnitrophota bacterium]
MKKESISKEDKDDMRSEYQREELDPGIRGKYFKAYQEGTDFTVFNPDMDKIVHDKKRSKKDR